jgi:hypothetical protein
MGCERPGLTRPDDDRCENLRWKGLVVEAIVRDPTVPRSNDRIFW